MLFDLDGTLIDSIELILSSARHAFEGWPRARPPTEEWVRGIGTPLVQQLRAYADSEDEVALLLERYRRYQHEHHDRLTRCYDDVPDVVAALSERGHPLAVVTSKGIADRSPEPRVRRARPATSRSWSATTTRPATSPTPSPFTFALSRLGVAADRAVFVGDSPHDIHAGNAAGVMTIAALWGPFDRETLADAQPDHFIGCLAELPGVLDRAFGMRDPGHRDPPQPAFRRFCSNHLGRLGI